MSLKISSGAEQSHDHDHAHHGHDHTDRDHSPTAPKGGHSHGPGGHHHGPASFDRAFSIGTALNAAFVLAETVFGFTAHSLALLSDAAHNLGDVFGLLLAWGAVWLSRRRPTRRRTYGYGRSSILASLINAIVLLIGVGAIALEALRRLGDPQPVSEGTVVWVAALGIAINGLTALLFMSGRKTDLNIRGAFLHMAGDAAVSLGVVVAALCIGWTGWLWLDPTTSLAIGAVIIITTWTLLRDSVNLAMDVVPSNIDQYAVEAYLCALPGVIEIHDLHIWPLSTTDTALTAHLVRPGARLDDAFTLHIAGELRKNFGIGHATFQIETQTGALECGLAPAHVV